MNLITIALAVFLAATSSSTEIYQKPLEPVKAIYYQPNHQQKIYLGALEYCESGGRKEAINPDDGGSPSFHSFQFKKETFEYYLKRYDIPKAPISDYNTQYLIVSQMLNDKSVQWNKQFPACVKKLGWPPKSGSEMTL